MLYLDSNVFIYATLNSGRVGNRDRSLIRVIQEGKESAASSVLAFEELVWAVKKYRSIEDAVIAGEAFLNLRGLNMVDATGEVLASALALMKKYGIDPKDSIHAASELKASAELIVTTNKDFDKVEEIQRRPI